MKKITIIGGGLSGLIASIRLVRAGIPVQLFEKKSYPFHRVCGEYISNEVVPFLTSLDLFPHELGPVSISRFQLTSVKGSSTELPLDLGGFGVSRYNFDHWLYKQAQKEGVTFHLDCEVDRLTFDKDHFRFYTGTILHEAEIVVGAFGKRSKVDIQMERAFAKTRSPYVGVKYHIRTDQPSDLISLHNFDGGYCGISMVENGVSNLCYMTHREKLKTAGSIQALEEMFLCQNPFLKSLFANAQFLFDQPETINEISFRTKSPVENHVLMCGDAAGMITPLCGNGMAMAIHSAKLLSDLILEHYQDFSRDKLESEYTTKWKSQFAGRLRAGRVIQRLFGSASASNLAVTLAKNVKPVAHYLISKTHGNPF